MNYTLDWGYLDGIMERFFAYATNLGMDDLKNWYYSQRGNNAPITDPILREWILSGVPIIQRGMNFIQRDLEQINHRLDTIFTSSMSLSRKMELSQTYREGLKSLQKLRNDLLGCRGEIGSWFRGILELLSRTFPNDRRFRQSLPYFDQLCLVTRKELLKYSL